MKSKFEKFIKKLIKIVNMPEMGILPGQLAFFFVLSIIPLIALLGSLAGVFGISIDTILEFLEKVIPSGVVDMFAPIITGEGLNVGTIIFYVSSFLLASNGTHSMILASNMIYDIKNKDYLSRRLKAIIMIFILVSLLIFILVVPAFGDSIVNFIASLIKNELIGNNLILLYSIFKYPLSLIFIFIGVKLLYTLAPDDDIKSKYTNYGSVFTTLGWILATEVYSVYVEVFSKYNLFYGSISNLLILMLWIYILAFIFVIGMVLNAGYYKSESDNGDNNKKTTDKTI